jgi:hypothetical protein
MGLRSPLRRITADDRDHWFRSIDGAGTLVRCWRPALPARRGNADQQPRQLETVAGVEPIERRQRRKLAVHAGGRTVMRHRRQHRDRPITSWPRTLTSGAATPDTHIGSARPASRSRTESGSRLRAATIEHSRTRSPRHTAWRTTRPRPPALRQHDIGHVRAHTAPSVRPPA